MLQFPQTDPTIYQEFLSGNHVVTRSNLSLFKSICSDLDLEQSVVKDSKSRKGGIIDINRQGQASLKWYLTIHMHSAMLSIFKEFCGVSKIEENVYRMLKPSMKLKDEEDINKMINVTLDHFGNPFAVQYS